MRIFRISAASPASRPMKIAALTVSRAGRRPQAASRAARAGSGQGVGSGHRRLVGLGPPPSRAVRTWQAPGPGIGMLRPRRIIAPDGKIYLVCREIGLVSREGRGESGMNQQSAVEPSVDEGGCGGWRARRKGLVQAFDWLNGRYLGRPREGRMTTVAMTVNGKSVSGRLRGGRCCGLFARGAWMTGTHIAVTPASAGLCGACERPACEELLGLCGRCGGGGGAGPSRGWRTRTGP